MHCPEGGRGYSTHCTTAAAVRQASCVTVCVVLGVPDVMDGVLAWLDIITLAYFNNSLPVIIGGLFVFFKLQPVSACMGSGGFPNAGAQPLLFSNSATEVRMAP